VGIFPYLISYSHSKKKKSWGCLISRQPYLYLENLHLPVIVIKFSMPKGKSNKVTFKPYDQKQILLIPPTAEELIAPDHLVRVVDSTVDQLNLQKLLEQYPGGGASRYHPLMLLKVLIYSYLDNTRSSRNIAKKLRENIYYRWISGAQSPDFRTINAFRKDRLAPVIDEVFVEVVRLLHSHGFVQLNTIYVDGTKIESRANRYRFVWKKAVVKNEANLEEKVRTYLREAEEITNAENLEYGDEDFPETGDGTITSETIKQLAQKLNKTLEKLDTQEDSTSNSKKVKKNFSKFKNPSKEIFFLES
jgi:transposase